MSHLDGCLLLHAQETVAATTCGSVADPVVKLAPWRSTPFWVSFALGLVGTGRARLVCRSGSLLPSLRQQALDHRRGRHRMMRADFRLDLLVARRGDVRVADVLRGDFKRREITTLSTPGAPDADLFALQSNM